MIRCEQVAFSYDKTKEILKDISFELDGGHFLALLGNNGAGKSTLLKCLNGIYRVSSGCVWVDKSEIQTLKRRQIAQSMAYVEQSSEASQFTVYDTVLMGRKPFIQTKPSDEDFLIVEKAIDRMQLRDFALRYTDELSGGELQKVIIARALAQQHTILLLDEPTSNLDLYNQHEVMQLIQEIARQDHILVIVVIHDLNLALRYCDRFLFMKDGLVYSYGDESTVTEKTIFDIYHVHARVLKEDGRTFVLV